METNNQTTVLDILIDVNRMLNDVKIPMSAVETIGFPVARAINGIQMCIDAIMKSNKEQTESADKQADEGSDQDA